MNTIRSLIGRVDAGEEAAIPLSEARKHPLLAAPHVSQLLRWLTRGCLANDRVTIVKLEAFRRGSRWFTTAPAVTRFVKKLSGETTDEIPPATKAAHKKAHEKLVAAGIAR